jgi:hypothetical protein
MFRKEPLGSTNAGLVDLRQLNVFAFLAGTQDASERPRFAGFLLMRGHPAQIQLHLALVGCFELAELQLDGSQTLQSTVIEPKIDVVIVVVDLQLLLWLGL